MPRIAKEKKDENDKIDKVKKATASKVADKKTTTKKTSDTAKKATAKKSTTKAASKTATTKKSTAKAASKATTTKKSTAKTASKTTTAKKSTTKATSKISARKTTKRKLEKSSEPTIQIIEYYDLPYKYGNTIVKILAQTPKTLFVYWEISDKDIESFKKQYGDNFLEITKPILVVHNLTLNKTYEVEINDFANCWYLNTDDTDCKFDIELARKFISSKTTKTDNLYIAKSNDLQSPNNHIMFEKLTDVVVFRNSKNDEKIEENIQSFKFLKDIYKFYQDMYTDELLNNPSSKF